MPGLVPGIPLRWALYVHKRDGRVKPGHDKVDKREDDASLRLDQFSNRIFASLTILPNFSASAATKAR
jgi:hypothetical protein